MICPCVCVSCAGARADVSQLDHMIGLLHPSLLSKTIFIQLCMFFSLLPIIFILMRFDGKIGGRVCVLPRFRKKQENAQEKCYKKKKRKRTLLRVILFLTGLPVAAQHIDVAALLIKFDACVNATDKWAFTPLHEASQKGRTQLCALLLAHGADPTLTNQEGQAPLDLVTVRARSDSRGRYAPKCSLFVLLF